jgi:hypothetical protein
MQFDLQILISIRRIYILHYLVIHHPEGGPMSVVLRDFPAANSLWD